MLTSKLDIFTILAWMTLVKVLLVYERILQFTLIVSLLRLFFFFSWLCSLNILQKTNESIQFKLW